MEGLRGMTPLSDAELHFKLSITHVSRDPAALARRNRQPRTVAIRSRDELAEAMARLTADFMRGGTTVQGFISARLRRGEDHAAGEDM